LRKKVSIMKKKILILAILVGLGYAGYKYLYHDHRDIASEEAAFSVTVPELLKEFETDETKANAKYLDKSVLVKGKITSVDVPNKTVVLDEKVFAILSATTDVKISSEIAVQGRVIGYDSLLGEIKLDQATIK
jgi:hypothetical protein